MSLELSYKDREWVQERIEWREKNALPQRSHMVNNCCIDKDCGKKDRKEVFKECT